MSFCFISRYNALDKVRYIDANIGHEVKVDRLVDKLEEDYNTVAYLLVPAELNLLHILFLYLEFIVVRNFVSLSFATHQ